MIINLPKIFYGEGSIRHLSSILQEYKKVLLITGKGSIKKSGLYEELIDEVKSSDVELIEFWGIKPNPTRSQMNEVAKLGIEKGVDFIIAAGGGSAIDASKVIATMIANPEIEDAWDFIVESPEIINTPIDIVSIVTMAGTGSENNSGTVITNTEIDDKRATHTRAPKFAIEDPKYTLTVNAWQTGSGIFDAFSHVTEQWFSLSGAFAWTDNYNIAQLKTLIEFGPKAVADLNDLEARSNVLISTTMALNGFSSLEMPDKDFAVHQISHAIAGKYDTTHGATLAMLTPAYWEFFANKSEEFKNRALKIGKELWGVDSIEETLDELNKFIADLKMPKSFKDFKGLENISEVEIDEILPKVSEWIKLSKAEVKEILMKLI